MHLHQSDHLQYISGAHHHNYSILQSITTSLLGFKWKQKIFHKQNHKLCMQRRQDFTHQETRVRIRQPFPYPNQARAEPLKPEEKNN